MWLPKSVTRNSRSVSYTNYVAPEKRDEELEKRFYYTNYVAPEKRDEEATNSV